MVTKELLKAEIDRVPDEHLGVLYRIVKALEEPGENPEIGKLKDSAWKALLKSAYGSTADAPIERGEQGSYEVREPLGVGASQQRTRERSQLPLKNPETL